MKTFLFFFCLFFCTLKNGWASPICPIMKTIVSATSIDKNKIVNFCDLDTHYKFTFGNIKNPEIILYKKSHEIILKMPVKGTKLEVLDGEKRYEIRDTELSSYVVSMDDEKGTVIFTELDIQDSKYINRTYVLLNKRGQ